MPPAFAAYLIDRDADGGVGGRLTNGLLATMKQAGAVVRIGKPV